MNNDCAALLAAFPGMTQWGASPTSCCGIRRELAGNVESIIDCDGDGRITQIVCRWAALASGGVRINGTLAPLAVLSELRRLDVSENRINGTIPAAVVQLKNLEYLSISGNAIFGSLPILSDSITFIDLGDLHLTGPLPELLPKAMQVIAISRSGLSGPIPTAWARIQSLQDIYMDGLLLSGLIPTEFGLLARLRLLHLANSDIRGFIPSELGAISSLISLDLRNNSLTGSIPASFFSKYWIKLDVTNNTLAGEVPQSLWENSQFRASGNCFSTQPQATNCPPLDSSFVGSQSATQRIIIAVVIVALCVTCAVGLLIHRRKKHHQQQATVKENKLMELATKMSDEESSHGNSRSIDPQPLSGGSSRSVISLFGTSNNDTEISKQVNGVVAILKPSVVDSMYTQSTDTVAAYEAEDPTRKKGLKSTIGDAARAVEERHPNLWTVKDVVVWCTAQLPHLESVLLVRIVERNIDGSRLVAMRRNEFSEQFGLVFADAVVLEEVVDAVVQRNLKLSLPSYEQSEIE
ncbi:hypothetical protein BJ741DRAFT_613657 [Chytriomyces cf. hyalinus JEL632]|nr:hypothetical protein BJ741DRAFT_613657 [Chytriomyces cf. hyalinus JEL632]